MGNLDIRYEDDGSIELRRYARENQRLGGRTARRMADDVADELKRHMPHRTGNLQRSVKTRANLVEGRAPAGAVDQLGNPIGGRFMPGQIWEAETRVEADYATQVDQGRDEEWVKEPGKGNVFVMDKESNPTRWDVDRSGKPVNRPVKPRTPTFSKSVGPFEGRHFVAKTAAKFGVILEKNAQEHLARLDD